MNILIKSLLGIGDWGLGIGQSPIPNPQSPSPNLLTINKIKAVIKAVV